MHNLLTRITILYFTLNLYFLAISNGQTQRNPFSPNASLIRYWNKQVLNNLPKPYFLFSKSSPLNTIDSAFLSKLANNHTLLAAHLDSFCSLANLFCSFDANQDLNKTSNMTVQDASFAFYSNKRFSTYGESKLGGVDSFKNYSDGLNSASGSFIKYSKDSTDHSETFVSYASDGNIADSTFGNYANGATGGSGQFKSYAPRVNVPGLRFTTYDSDGNSHKISFSSYSDETNSGSHTFTSYGKKANGAPSEFINYSDDANIVESTFTGYGALGNAANDSFASYGIKGNNPKSNFKSYGVGGNSGVDSFSNYRNGANVGQDSFQSYARNSNSGKVSFSNYGKTFNPGNDTFKDYGNGSKGQTQIGFKGYSKDRSFKDYIDKGVTFAGYTNFSDSSGSFVNKWVEEGKFFRESMLNQGNVMVMPDINDKMPRRSFLPRSIGSKLPFSTSSLPEMKEIFHAREKSTLERVILNALAECERAPSPGETKKCVGSIEDMLDFAVSVLGHSVVVRTTENVNGSKQSVRIGLVKGINGGKVTESVSCHQSMYPYLLYYCHSVPKVRVYEVDIHDVEVRKAKINRGVAICHLDTSAWNPEHGAFVALGSSPGQIEVCHWIFENDMTWTISDD
ncbi:polygalacturonase non-catalytic subunit [Tripterygium wilfordii]|uniref:Polygalacturonase non-catalytic subunit n=1 Tax=Tripterygium wilfordii TaxID=458696 RepID=A0A7J7CL57_TRIWF|nr:polygalacturonase 1 beta-like protein 1 [Tripterygium wilfordii]KAF5734751.1 polygalacturonase non-catalytic subunit [Tripterygium wilfordii]